MPEQLPGPKRAANLGIVHCASSGCDSVGLALPEQDGDGSLRPKAPVGWREIQALSGQGDELHLFVCSPACERRLARRLTAPKLGSLDG